MRLAKGQSIKAASIPGRRSIEELALETFRERFKGEEGSKVYRAIERLLEPRARKKGLKRAAIVARAIDNPVASRLVKQATPQGIKSDLREELEALSKRVAFAQTPGMDPVTKVGPCFTCGAVTRLQWGHFIAQAACPMMIYHPHNTRGQCGTCNGHGQGEQVKFRDALEEQTPGRTIQLLTAAMQYGKARARISDLEADLKRLKAVAHNIGLEVE
jgi:hypothetical protein